MYVSLTVDPAMISSCCMTPAGSLHHTQTHSDFFLANIRPVLFFFFFFSFSGVDTFLNSSGEQ